MSKRIKNIYDETTSFEALLKAESDSWKSAKKRRRDIHIFRMDLEDHLHDDVHLLERYQFPEISYREFVVYEPKPRKIIYADYNSKVIERTFYNKLNPLLSNRFIEDTYSCVVDRGQLKAMQRLYSWFQYLRRQPGQWYYYKLDVAKFFYRIDHKVLMNQFEKWIGDWYVLDALEYYLCNDDHRFGLRLTDDPRTIDSRDMLTDIGIPIGGGLSHTAGNVALNDIDQLAKRTLGIKYYIRYMDDIIFLGNNKGKMREQKIFIEDYLNKNLHLELNNKTALRPIKNGCEFVGCVIYPDHVILRKQTTLRMKRRLKRVMKDYSSGILTLEEAHQTVAAYKAILKYVDCKNFDQKIWTDFVLHRPDAIPEEQYINGYKRS